MYKRGSRVDKEASRLGWLHASLSRTIQIENNETNDCETLFPCALLEKDGEIERSRVEIEFRFLLPSFPPTPIRPPARSGWDWDEGRREARVFRGMFVADFVHLARHVESTDLPTILSPLSSLSPPVHAPISNSTPSSLFPSDPSLTTDLRPIH